MALTPGAILCLQCCSFFLRPILMSLDIESLEKKFKTSRYHPSAKKRLGDVRSRLRDLLGKLEEQFDGLLLMNVSEVGEEGVSKRATEMRKIVLRSRSEVFGILDSLGSDVDNMNAERIGQNKELLEKLREFSGVVEERG
jgi:hypothetical protein